MAQERYIPRPKTRMGKLGWQATNLCIYLGNHYFTGGLTDKEMTAYRTMVDAISDGRYLPISNEIGDVIDHGVSFWGAENLESLKERPFIVVANHWKNGPLKGNWHPQATSFVLQEVLGREMTWVQGPGDEHNFLTKPFKPFVERVHKRIAAVNRSIYWDGKNVVRVGLGVHRELRKGGIVGFCAEEKQTKSLVQADGKIGDLLYKEALNGVPVVGVASFQWGEELIAAITKVIEPEVIRSFGNAFPEEERGQAVIDFVFGGFIAQEMPENLQGYYQKYAAIL